MKYVSRIILNNNEVVFTDEEVTKFLNENGYNVINVLSSYYSTSVNYPDIRNITVAIKIGDRDFDEKYTNPDGLYHLDIFSKLIHKRYNDILKENLLDTSYIRNRKIDDICK